MGPAGTTELNTLLPGTRHARLHPLQEDPSLKLGVGGRDVVQSFSEGLVVSSHGSLYLLNQFSYLTGNSNLLS